MQYPEISTRNNTARNTKPGAAGAVEHLLLVPSQCSVRRFRHWLLGLLDLALVTCTCTNGRVQVSTRYQDQGVGLTAVVICEDGAMRIIYLDEHRKQAVPNHCLDDLCNVCRLSVNDAPSNVLEVVPARAVNSVHRSESCALVVLVWQHASVSRSCGSPVLRTIPREAA